MDFNKNNLYKEIKNFNLEELKQLALFIRNKISNIASLGIVFLRFSG